MHAIPALAPRSWDGLTSVRPRPPILRLQRGLSNDMSPRSPPLNSIALPLPTRGRADVTVPEFVARQARGPRRHWPELTILLLI